MSEGNAAPAEQALAQKLITELKVSGHLMALDPGLFCIVQMPSRATDPASGMPGVRISLPPGAASRPDAVTISTFRADGWLSGGGDAALVRVVGGPAQILVTIYQAPQAREGAPNLQVLRLLEPAAAPARAAAAPAAPVAIAAPTVMEMVAHIQGRGDVGAMLGEWLGIKGSKAWIEGFGIAPGSLVAAKDIEYQAVLGRGWLSPWVEGGQFCGSRGMALPILGLRVRLRAEAAEQYEVVYSAAFVDGVEIGPVADGEACEAESMAAMEAFRVELRPKFAATAPAADAPAAATMADPAATADEAEAEAEPSADAKPGKKGARKAPAARGKR